jgi:hypothetical protein
MASCLFSLSTERLLISNKLMIKTILCILPILILVSPFAAYAQNDAPKPFPKGLFGVNLGGIHNYGSSDDKHLETGTFPVKKITIVDGRLSPGRHTYFQPLKEYEAFKYIEKKKKPDDKFFPTSFRLYVLPIIPKDKSLKELSTFKFKFNVNIIEWSEEVKQDLSLYVWAKMLCEDIGADLGMKPTVKHDSYELSWYECNFIENDKELIISSVLGSKRFTLKYIKKILDERSEAVDNLAQKFRMNKIRPY